MCCLSSARKSPVPSAGGRRRDRGLLRGSAHRRARSAGRRRARTAPGCDTGPGSWGPPGPGSAGWGAGRAQGGRREHPHQLARQARRHGADTDAGHACGLERNSCAGRRDQGSDHVGDVWHVSDHQRGAVRPRQHVLQGRAHAAAARRPDSAERAPPSLRCASPGCATPTGCRAPGARAHRTWRAPRTRPRRSGGGQGRRTGRPDGRSRPGRAARCTGGSAPCRVAWVRSV